MAISDIVNDIYIQMAPMWVELSFLLFFTLGFCVLRIDLITRKTPTKTKAAKTIEEPHVKSSFDGKLKKTLETEAAAGNQAAVVAAWRAGRSAGPTPPDLLKLVVLALIDTEPEKVVEEIADHMYLHASVLGNARVAANMLDIVARAGRIDTMQELWDLLQRRLQIPSTSHTYEVLLGGYAFVGDQRKVDSIIAELRAGRLKLTARGYSLIIKGFLKNSMVDCVLHQIQDMQKHGFHAPSFAVTQFFRISCDAGRGAEVFETLVGEVTLPSEAITQLLEDCFKRHDIDLAKRVEQVARDAKVPLVYGAYDAILKLYAMHGDPHALDLFEEMQGSGIRISEGLCVGLLARCADTKFLRFAEDIVRFARARDGMTIAVYSALMKVYAYCGMYDKACALYDRIREDGLEPDAMMYGCLMKFAVECGRTDLSRELSEKAPTLDIQNYMSLIRAAGRDKDVDRAFAVLKKLKDSGVSLDIAAHNCVLDVCVTAGDMKRARLLIEDMKKISALDIITYNTLLKGFCVGGRLHDAKELLVEMKQVGLPPNDVSYNCLINAAVSCGDFREAWDIIDLMEKDGVAVDHYTISIMMKALKRVRKHQDVARALALLDRTGISVCSDEILLNTVLETCIRHRECVRIESVLNSFHNSDLRPSVHTYGSLIKACSTLKTVDRCWEFWRHMTDHRGMEPNDIVLGCMLDALVCNHQIDDAVKLLEEWKTRVPPNTVIYSTIIKGFANSHQAGRAMETWREMRAAGITLNTVVYNAVIDAQSRVGAMEEVSELIQAMEPDGCGPDVITYSTIVKGYCVRGDLDKAFEVFHNMQKNDMAGDAIIYNTVLDGCTRHGRMDLADELLADMERYQVIPSNFTLGILVKMWGRRRNLDKAFEVVERLPRVHGFQPNAQVRTCLMCACLNNNSIDRAFEVFDDLKKSGQCADAKAYGVLISGCVRQGQLQQAVNLVDEAYGLNGGKRVLPHEQQLEMDCLEQLLRTLAQKGQMEQVGGPLLERLRAAKAPVNGRLFSSMLGGGSFEPRGHVKGDGGGKGKGGGGNYGKGNGKGSGGKGKNRY